MAARITFNTPKFKGEYLLDFDRPLTAVEWEWIKKISGYMPNTYADGIAGGDPKLYIALAVVTLVRAEKVREVEVLEVADSLARLPFDGAALSFVLESDEEDDEADPPEPATTPDTEPLRSIGGSSRSTSGHQEPLQRATGAPA